ncbi:P-loop containing nucleoside triphosphate hydrolase protein [Zychaea mexicana]|uniref:P-loop containing nucleoside triphosphate hydrolase protein n=1 Tax=Zychaea mexicana TaxID=64656 RepID=UPI0022FE9D3D|nr:P-loop containing nucleoside triphosphate hydrolase protein [Zychaea mexicana]KAI9484720.1 P-loop containing nucleoside triphosphate hydrolase protein [Zychaea mexicana]
MQQAKNLMNQENEPKNDAFIKDDGSPGDDNSKQQQQHTPQDDSKKKNEKSSVPIYKLFRFASKTDFLMIAVAMTGSIGIGVIHPVSIIIFGQFLENLAGTLYTSDELLAATLDMILIFVYMGVAVFVAGYVAHAFWVLSGESQARRIRQFYVHSILAQDMSWFDKSEEGSLTTRLATDTQMIQDGISEKLGLLVQMVAAVITGVVVAFVKGWQLAVVMLAPIPLLAGVSTAMTYFYSKYTKSTQDIYADAGAIAEQVFAGIRTVYAFSLQRRFSARYDKELEKACVTGSKRGVLLGCQFGVFLCILFWSYGLAFWYGSKLADEEKLSGPLVLIAFYAMLIGTMSLLSLPLNLAAVSSACGAAYRIFAVIDRVPDIDPDTTDGIANVKLQGHIQFRDIDFSYPTRSDIQVLQKFNAQVHAGKTIALVGASGSGKSTVVQMLQRFYDPLSGSILLDGKDIKEYNVSWLRRQIGVVSQEPVLFNMTIRQNLLMGTTRDDVTDEDIIEACKKANCHGFIKQLPEAYDTPVGEHGGMLSGGQKQRIAIARAIIKNPTILLLDEATSALDTQSERLVQNALDAAAENRTTIVIAHRLSTIRNADTIIVLKQGVMVEQGNHQELIEMNGAYADLVRKQEIAMKEEEEKEDLHQQKLHDDEPLDISQSTEALNNNAVIANKQDILDLKRTNSTASSKHEVKMEIQREIQEKECGKPKLPFFKVLMEMRPEWLLIITGTFGAMISGAVFPVCSLLLARVITIIIDPHMEINPGPMQGANLYAFLFLIVGLAALLGFVIQMASFEVAGERYTKRLRSRIFWAYMKQEVAFYDEEKNNVGALTSMLAVDAKHVNELMSKICGEVASLMFTGVTGFVIAFAHSWALTLIVLGCVPFMVAATAYESKVEMGYANDVQKASAQSGEVAGEAIKAIRTVASLTKQYYFEAKYEEAIERPHKLAQRKAYLASIGYALGQAISLFTHAVAFYGGVRLIEIEMITLQDMMVVLLAVMITSQNIGRVTTYMSGIAKAKYAALSAYEIIERRSKIDPELEGVEPDTVRGDITCDKVGFQYPTRSVPIFRGEFALQGMAGKTIALVGSSGCGKSTTIGMLERWYDPTAGTVRLDEHSTQSFSLHNLRSHMALVSQEPVLFDLTIGENIRFGALSEKGVSQEQVEHACRAANIHHFITSLPNGYETRVGDKGSQLSGGQKQRIAIARALIRKPRVLLLDEATSALDSESEKLVQDAIDNVISEGGRTTITIAHRLSTIQGADQICVIEGGRIVEQGTHWDLLKLNGIYTELVQQQSLSTI